MLQAARHTDITSWAPQCSGRFKLEDEWARSNAFMWDGHMACNGVATDVQSRAQLSTPSHAALRSCTPRAVPLPTQRSADARLATSGAACAQQNDAQQSKLGPGCYKPPRSAFGEERRYKHVVRPQSGQAAGVRKDAGPSQIVASLVKKCVACFCFARLPAVCHTQSLYSQIPQVSCCGFVCSLACLMCMQDTF